MYFSPTAEFMAPQYTDTPETRACRSIDTVKVMMSTITSSRDCFHLVPPEQITVRYVGRLYVVDPINFNQVVLGWAFELGLVFQVLHGQRNERIRP